MDGGNIQMPAVGRYPYTAGPYEPMKEEMEVLSRPNGTAINSTTVNMTTYQQPPRDHIIWSIFNAMFMNFCCLGFLALVFSVKLLVLQSLRVVCGATRHVLSCCIKCARDRKIVGDIHGATSYGSTAKSLNIAALVLSLLFIILFIVLLATGVIAFQSAIRQQAELNPNFWGPGSGK
ncbi:interferon-induced transmembrane protein 1-like isoform X1 [Ambystoma mexicanum]|uniref:interferon-induced transmembrane protein 1-like isoform X1 n=1 Tax=Ambystoma mexicanum TaxID=8296 RepID=UPI0037E9B45E